MGMERVEAMMLGVEGMFLLEARFLVSWEGTWWL
jgi:hypothetical protein